MPIHFKVCCIRSEEEMRLAADAGAWGLGFVSTMPSGPGVLAEPEVDRLIGLAPLETARVLLTSLPDAIAIIDRQRKCRASVLQLCTPVRTRDLARLREFIPGITLVQVIYVRGPVALEEALSAAPHVDALLLDSGAPEAAVPILGGTGRTHDWELSAEIVRRAGKPVLLAGGINPANVGEAIARVRPWGIDICSGLRDEECRLVPAKLAAFTEALRRAEAALAATPASRDGAARGGA